MDPNRLTPASYSLHSDYALRFSDLVDGQLSRVAVAHVFESLRSEVVDALPGLRRRHTDAPGPRWHSLLRGVTLEFLAPVWGDAPISLASAISAVGRSSHRSAMAVFQQGRCVALGEATNVTIDADRRPAALPPAVRESLLTALLPQTQPALPATDPPALASVDDYPFSLVLPTRFSDTDAVGHLNNVAVSRFHDNALMAFQHACEGRFTRWGEAGHWQVKRQVVAMSAENFYPQPLHLGLRVAAISATGFTLHQALFQKGRCTGTAQADVELVDAQGQARALTPALVAQLQRWGGAPTGLDHVDANGLALATPA